MKDYYKILALAKDADHESVRQSYRKLAKQFHPDVNPAPDAHFKFAEINEAYAVLSDPEKRKAYDERFLKAYLWMFEEMIDKSKATQTARSMNDMVREARLRAEKAKEHQREFDKKYYRTFRKRAQIILTSLLVFNLVVFTDYFLPFEKFTDVVIERDNKVRTLNANFPVEKALYFDSLKPGKKVQIARTPIFNQNRKLSFAYSGEMVVLDAEYNIYKGFIFVPVIIFIFGIISLLIRTDDYLTYSLAMISLMLYAVELYFIYISI
ncbi:MAG TPA: hypothetical protein DCQ31_01375 [Bacteroidales bacterium]|nr:hypothetical protein [Bacteroidales bacterium]